MKTWSKDLVNMSIKRLSKGIFCKEISSNVNPSTMQNIRKVGRCIDVDYA